MPSFKACKDTVYAATIRRMFPWVRDTGKSAVAERLISNRFSGDKGACPKQLFHRSERAGIGLDSQDDDQSTLFEAALQVSMTRSLVTWSKTTSGVLYVLICSK